jgi:hypothetical protein
VANCYINLTNRKRNEGNEILITNKLAATRGQIKKTTSGGTDCGAIKVSSDGTRVLWATWLGGSADESNAASIRVDTDGYVSLYFHTLSSDMPTTDGAFDRTRNGDADMAVAKFSPTGALLTATYLGGSGTENADGVYVDSEGNVFITGETSSDNFPITSNAYQKTFGGGKGMLLLCGYPLTFANCCIPHT